MAQRRFLDSTWGYAGHPMYVRGLAELAVWAGARLAWAVSWSAELPEEAVDGLPGEVAVVAGLTAAAFERKIEAEVARTDLLIGHHGALRLAASSEIGVMEWGFPSWHHHALYDEPFLGYRGARCFLGRVADHLNDQDFAID
jgi:nitrogenase molybdenum-iron protein alpha/beta subunit